MSKLWARLAGVFRSRTQVGVDKAGNQYFTRIVEIDGIMKEKRWVIFKGEDDPTSIPVEWICWLNGQRKKAPTLEEMAELEARRERVKMNVALLKKEEERKASCPQQTEKPSKVGGPDLKSFIRQFPSDDSGSGDTGSEDVAANEREANEEIIRSSEPTGSGPTFRPGTWQPPS